MAPKLKRKQKHVSHVSRETKRPGYDLSELESALKESLELLELTQEAMASSDLSGVSEWKKKIEEIEQDILKRSEDFLNLAIIVTVTPPKKSSSLESAEAQGARSPKFYDELSKKKAQVLKALPEFKAFNQAEMEQKEKEAYSELFDEQGKSLTKKAANEAVKKLFDDYLERNRQLEVLKEKLKGIEAERSEKQKKAGNFADSPNSSRYGNFSFHYSSQNIKSDKPPSLIDFESPGGVEPESEKKPEDVDLSLIDTKTISAISNSLSSYFFDDFKKTHAPLPDPFWLMDKELANTSYLELNMELQEACEAMGKAIKEQIKSKPFFSRQNYSMVEVREDWTNLSKDIVHAAEEKNAIKLSKAAAKLLQFGEEEHFKRLTAAVPTSSNLSISKSLSRICKLLCGCLAYLVQRAPKPQTKIDKHKAKEQQLPKSQSEIYKNMDEISRIVNALQVKIKNDNEVYDAGNLEI